MKANFMWDAQTYFLRGPLFGLMLAISICGISCATYVNEDGSIRLEEGTLYREESNLFDYVVFVPKPKTVAKKEYPALVVFHGSGGDPRAYVSYWIKEAEERQMIIVAPAWEAPKTAAHVEMDVLADLIAEASRKHAIDSSQQYLVGLSAGGLVARWLFEAEPSRWQGAMFIAFGPESGWLDRLGDKKFPPMYFAVGARDEQVNLDLLWKGVNQLKRNGTRVDYLVDPKAGHEHRPTWTKRMLDWMLDDGEEKPVG